VSLEFLQGSCSPHTLRELDWHSSCGNRFIVRSVLVDRAAELLGISRRTVYYRIREGELQTFRTRGGSQRVLLDSIERLLREGKKARRTRKRRVESLDAPPLGICNGEDAAGQDAGV
jgi:excisionase family DNA binding protein